jgi:hypothetical protein
MSFLFNDMHDTCELDDLDLLTAPTVVLMRIIAEITEWTLLPITCARPQESGVVHTVACCCLMLVL